VGTSEAGGLSILGTAQIPVSLSSTSDVPMPGDWGGIVLGPMTAMNTSIQYTRIAYAGEPLPGVLGAITLSGTDARVRIAATEFLDTAQADIYVDCMSQPLLTGNVYSFLGPVFEFPCP
jgi:hypothetical protein